MLSFASPCVVPAHTLSSRSTSTAVTLIDPVRRCDRRDPAIAIEQRQAVFAADPHSAFGIIRDRIDRAGRRCAERAVDHVPAGRRPAAHAITRADPDAALADRPVTAFTPANARSSHVIPSGCSVTNRSPLVARNARPRARKTLRTPHSDPSFEPVNCCQRGEYIASGPLLRIGVERHPHALAVGRDGADAAVPAVGQ